MIRVIGFVSVVLTSQMLTTAAQSETCTGANAVYRIDGAEGFELKLSLAKEKTAWSDLEAALKTPQRTLTFSFTASNGYSFNYLVQHDFRDQDELSIHAYFFDDKMKAVGLPQSKGLAAKYLFAPELGSQLWYGDIDKREFLPVEFWTLQGC